MVAGNDRSPGSRDANVYYSGGKTSLLVSLR